MEIIAFITVFVVASGLFTVGVIAPFVLAILGVKLVIQKVNFRKTQPTVKAMRSERAVILQATRKPQSVAFSEDDKPALVQRPELFGEATDWSLYDSPAYQRVSRVVC